MLFSFLKRLYTFHGAINFVYFESARDYSAAHCNANILVQASEKEAIKWLGKDYPYLLKGRVTEEKVLKLLDYIKKSYGSKEWEYGLAIMRGIREKTSEEAIGKQLVKLFQLSGFTPSG